MKRLIPILMLLFAGAAHGQQTIRLGKGPPYIQGVLPPVNGGTGLATSGTSGNVLTSNGVGWISAPPVVGSSDLSQATGQLGQIHGGTGGTSPATARTALGLAIGTDVLAPTGSAVNLANLERFHIPAVGLTSQAVVYEFKFSVHQPPALVTGLEVLIGSPLSFLGTPAVMQLYKGVSNVFTSVATLTIPQSTAAHTAVDTLLSVPTTYNPGDVLRIAMTTPAYGGGYGSEIFLF